MTSALKLFQGRFGRVALLDSDKDLVMHSHSQCHVLIKAEGADTAFQVREQFYPLRQDTLVLVNAWEPHCKLHPQRDVRSTVLALYIEPDWLSGMDRRLSVSGLQGFFPRPCARIPPHVRALADQLIAGMYQPQRDAQDRARWEIALFELMMSLIYEFSAWRDHMEIYRASLRRPSDPRIRRAIRFMNENLDTKLPFDELARLCNLSRPHFFYLFKECTAVSPALYLNTLRMESAFGRLSADETAITALAGSLGFAEANHFTRFFRQNLGIPPSEYRRRVELFS
ncbi:MAG: AraC family transcriptional regulator [Pseudomonadota bacterium]|mgnify:FL=1